MTSGLPYPNPDGTSQSTGPLSPPLPPAAYGYPPSSTTELTLAAAIAAAVADGWRVEIITNTSAVLVIGKKVNHVLHAIITLLTCLFWAVVWIILAVSTHETRMTITVTPDGRAHYSNPQRSR